MIKLISLNIERSKHLDRIAPFLLQENADVVCLQEVMEYDLPELAEIIGAAGYFVPTTIHSAEGKPGRFGQAIFSRLRVTRRGSEFYWGGGRELPVFDFTDVKTKHESEFHAVLYIDVEQEGARFRIAATHFTWTPDGKPDEYQRQDLKAMLAILENLGEFVLCGDINAPRGSEIFTAVAAQYEDRIPLRYTTSIDKNLHRAGALDLMVDGLFAASSYRTSDVRLQFGLSDHAAIIASVERR